MTHIRVVLRAYIDHPDGTSTVVERSVAPTAFGDNPIFFGDVVEQSADVLRDQVVDAVHAIHGTAPRPASVTFRP